MTEPERENFMEMLDDAMELVQPNEEGVFYLYGGDEYDISYFGNMGRLADALLNAMRNDELLRHTVSSAVYSIDDEGFNVSAN